LFNSYISQLISAVLITSYASSRGRRILTSFEAFAISPNAGIDILAVFVGGKGDFRELGKRGLKN
jgi:hypothetical protein